MQPTRSAIKCSKASRSSHTAVRRAPARAAAATGGGKGEVGRQHRSGGMRLRPGGRSCFQSVVLQDAWGTPVYVSGRATPQLLGRGSSGARGCLGRGTRAEGRFGRAARHLGAVLETHIQMTCNLSSSMLPLSVSPASLFSTSSSPRSMSSSLPASERVYAYPLMERQVKKTILFSLLL